MSESRHSLSIENRKQLLRFARGVAAVALGAAVEKPVARPDIPGRFGGAFVTFWRGKRLRGCVGTLAPTTGIVETIEAVTRASLKDQRFAQNPITASELSALEIEISILSDPTPTDDPASLVPGKHGIVIRRGSRSGCFLPKVASERGWSAESFLSNCCTMKAGLEADAWKLPDTEVLLFTAEVFSESSIG